MSFRFAAWRGTDDPDRVDAVSVEFGARSLRALGTSTARDYVSSWRLHTGADFVTRSLSARVTGANWARELELTRSGEGDWSVEASVSGVAVDLPAPGLVPGLSVDGLLDVRDCDIALCPLTNTMPIRRLGLNGQPQPETVIAVAWVDVPSLQVHRERQRYSSARDADGAPVVVFETDSRDFRAELMVDDAGLVLDYPEIATRLVA